MFPIAFFCAAMSFGAPAQPRERLDILEPVFSPHNGSGFGFGTDLALTDDWAVVGHYTQAAVYFYRHSSEGWTHTQTFRGPTSSRLGWAVDCDGDTTIVGLWGGDSGGAGPGEAWVFERVGSDWHHTASLRVPELEAGARFGFSVAVDGGTLVVGAPLHTPRPSETVGAIAIFERRSGTWEKAAVLPWTDCCPNDAITYLSRMGEAVDISGETVVATAPYSQFGEVFVFGKDPGGNWRRAAVIEDYQPETTSGFGRSIALEGDRLIIGRPDDRFQIGFSYGPGSVYVYERDPQTGAFDFRQHLQASDGHGGFDYGASFGWDVDLHAGRIVTSALNQNGGQVLDGKVYVFEQDATGTWLEVRGLTSPESQFETGLGRRVALSAEHLAASVWDHSQYGEQVYVFQNSIGAASCGDERPIDLTIAGSEYLEDEAVTLIARRVPAGSHGCFFWAESPHRQLFGGGGGSCLGAEFARLGPVHMATSSATIVQPVQFSGSALTDVLLAGSSVEFQFWARTLSGEPVFSSAVTLAIFH